MTYNFKLSIIGFNDLISMRLLWTFGVEINTS